MKARCVREVFDERVQRAIYIVAEVDVQVCMSLPLDRNACNDES